MKSNSKFYSSYNWKKMIASTLVDGHYEGTPKYLDIRFGNLCNLKCIMCSFPTSSKWFKKDSWVSAAKIDPYKENTAFWEDLNEIASEIDRIYFAGGEPLIADGHYKLLDILIENNLAENIDLVYSTNLMFFNEHIIELLSQFNSVHLGCSCDGVGETFEYIRTGAKWEKFVENTSKAMENGMDISLLVATQKDNIESLEDIIKWGVSKKIDVDLTNVLQFPKHFCISNLSEEQKDLNRERLSNFSVTFDFGAFPHIKDQLLDIIKMLET